MFVYLIIIENRIYYRSSTAIFCDLKFIYKLNCILRKSSVISEASEYQNEIPRNTNDRKFTGSIEFRASNEHVALVADCTLFVLL